MFLKRKRVCPTFRDPEKKDEKLPSLIWEEYKYRHEFCWNLLSRITVITATLSILPYISDGDNFTNQGKALVKVTPVIGFLFALLGLIRMCRELKLLDRVRALYRQYQNTVIRPGLKLKSSFSFEFMSYIIILTLMAAVNSVFVFFGVFDSKSLILVF